MKWAHHHGPSRHVNHELALAEGLTPLAGGLSFTCGTGAARKGGATMKRTKTSKTWYRTKAVFADGSDAVFANWASNPLDAAVQTYEQMQMICKDPPTMYVLLPSTDPSK